MISGPSVVSALIIYAIAALVISLLHYWSWFLGKGGLTVVLFAAVLAALRLVLPFEIVPASHAIRSWDALGAAHIYLRENPDTTCILLVTWIVGALLIAGHDVFVLWRAHEDLKEIRPVESLQVQEIAKKKQISCPVVVSPDVESPFVAGFLHHTIYFPAMELSDHEIELILAHEQEHVRTHDGLTKFVFGMLSAVMWWTMWFRGVVDTLLEMWCDARVTREMNEDETWEYTEVLTNVAKRVVFHKRRTPALSLDEFSAVSKKNRIMKRRFAVLYAREGKLPRYISTVGKCVLPVLFLMSYLIVIQPASVPKPEAFQDDSENYYHDNYDGPEFGDEIRSSFIIKGADGKYQLCINYTFSRYLTEDEVNSEKYQGLHVFDEERKE